MSYKLTKSDGTLLTTVADYTADTSSTSLSLLGRGVVNYGQLIAENFVYLLENFASPTPPPNPVVGQFWFQTANNSEPNNPQALMIVKVYTGDTSQGTPAGWMQIAGTNASATPPRNPYVGELWYDLSNNTLYVWDGSQWEQVNTTMGENPPTGVPSGNPPDGTLWLMMPEHMLWVFDSSISNPEPPFVRSGGTNDGKTFTGGWRLVGPQSPHGKGTYSAFTVLKDTGGTTHDVIVNYVDGFAMSILSPSAFTFSTSVLPNFTTYGSSGNSVKILPGVNVNNGNTVAGVFNGTASNSNLFAGLGLNEFIGRGDTSVPTIPAADNKYNFGDPSNRWYSISGTNILPGHSSVGQSDTSAVNVWGKAQASVTADKWASAVSVVLSGDVTGSGSSDGSSNFNVSTSLSDSIKSELANLESAIQGAMSAAQSAQNSANNANNAAGNALTQGAADNRYIQFTGTGDHGVSGNLGSSTSNCFANIYANTFEGTATHAKYSDLAEFYNGDIKYSYGTLLKIGGDAEVTQTTEHADVEFFGVVSHQPGFVMNNEKAGIENYVPVALSGRVPVRVIGPVKKGDRLVPGTIPGTAVSAGTMLDILALDTTERTLLQTSMVGRALEDKTTDEEGLVECYVQAR